MFVVTCGGVTVTSTNDTLLPTENCVELNAYPDAEVISTASNFSFAPENRVASHESYIIICLNIHSPLSTKKLRVSSS